MKRTEYGKLTVFGSEAVGKIFMPDGLTFSTNKVLIPSIIHGRSVAVKVSEYEWILVKGGGWNYNGPQVYISTKDQELVFGLNPYKAGLREYEVSKKIEEISDDFPKILYIKKFSDYTLPKELDFLKTVRFSSGELVDPCLTYTKVKCPYRVLDLAYKSDKEKEELIEFCCKYWNISKEQYVEKFTKELAKHVGILHKNGFINDTLEFSNVTMLAEIVDYELVTAPGVLFSDGTYGLEITDARREKEILYGAEIVIQLQALLQKPFSLYEAYENFVNYYKPFNEDFVNNNERIKEIIGRKKIVL